MRLPLEPLIIAGGCDTITGLASRIGVTARTVHRWAAGGLSVAQADRAAVALGFHPMSVWPAWGADLLLEAVAA